MTSRTTTRPGLANAIRAVAALTVIGSAVGVTVLTVRNDDEVATVVVSQERPVAAGQSGAVAPPEAPGAGAGSAENGAPPAAELPVAAGGAGVPSAVAISPGSPAPGGSTPLAAPRAGGPSAAVPLGGPSGPGGVAIDPAADAPSGQGAVPNGSTTPGGPSAAVPLGTGSPFAAAPVGTQPPCPLGWPAPNQQGGLASLIGLAPLAGPFSSEAFALGSVYQPILQLAGPVLAEIAPVITQYQPLIDPLITQVQGVEAIVLQAILPYYGPYRDQLIAAEGEFAKALAPVLNNVYNSEIASCFVAWQGQVIDQAKGGPIKVASLAHPGTVVELGPRS